jgi:hypothetical protein
MKQFFLSSLGVSALLICAIVFSTANPHLLGSPQSSEAIKARLKYEGEFDKLNADYAKKLDGLRQQYIRDLDIVRKKALEKEDLDEAQRLLEEKKWIEAKNQPGMAKGMGILCAVWGIDDKWVDVTHTLRGAVKNSQLHLNLSEPNALSSTLDVAPGRRKTLMVAYTFDGKVYLSLTRDDQPVDLPRGK